MGWRNRSWRAVASAASFAVFIAQATAQEFPTRPIKLVLGYSAGGPTDVVCRIIANEMREHLGQSVVVENMAGAGGGTGMLHVVRAEPDGYTLSYGALSNVVMVPLMNKNANYDPQKDLEPVAMTSSGAFTLVVNAQVPARDVKEFIAHAKANPGQLAFASAGFGSAPHMFALLFNRAAGVEGLHVPFKGGGDALTATIRGDTAYVFDTVQTSVGLEGNDRVRVLAVTDKESSAALPKVPTVSESGLPGFVATTWGGILAPKGTPAAVVARLNKAIAASVASKAVQERFVQLGLVPATGSPAEFATYIASEFEKWGKLVRDADLDKK